MLNGRSVAYTPPAAIEQQMRSALASLAQEQPGNLKYSRPAMRLAQNMATLFQAHPFREGNTRTLLAFMEQYARHHQQPLDQALINRVPSETRDALVLATQGQIRPLSEMVRNARYSEEQRAHPVPAADGAALVRNLLAVAGAHREARRAYRPAPSPVPITLFRARETAPGDGAAEADEALGWRDVSAAPIDVLWVPGDHVTMMAERHAPQLAESLRPHLAELGRTGPAGRVAQGR
ncbi:Fic family protein [Methylobacterium sp. Gmos1]